MRTTVRLDEELLHEVKRVVAEERTTMTAIFEQALREMLARRKQLRDRPRLRLPTSPGCGLQPGVDLDNSAALLDLMDEANGPA